MSDKALRLPRGWDGDIRSSERTRTVSAVSGPGIDGRHSSELAENIPQETKGVGVWYGWPMGESLV